MRDEFDTNMQYYADESIECPNCAGTGEIDTPLDCIQWGLETCDESNGTGFV